jgi:LacI family transcriptional regulator, galactose operon repressor
MTTRSDRTKPRSVRIADVAKLAGCAPATVSRRLNNPEKVSGDVARAIDRAIAELHYVRNDSARTLRSNRSRLIGAIIPTLSHSIYAQMIDGLQRRLSESGFALIHNTSGYDIDVEYEQARLLVERGAEAIVLVGTRHRSKTIDLLNQRNVKCVATYSLDDRASFTCIGFDNYRAASLAAECLISLGHRHFAMLAGITRNNDRAEARVEGFVDTLVEKGVPRADIVVCEAPYVIAEGRSAMERALDLDPRVTAVFCGSDILAVGALAECRRRSIKVPADVSIVGFDNLEIAAYTDPPLTTIDVPAIAMGEETANYLIRNSPDQSRIRRVELQVTIVHRGTTAAPGDRMIIESLAQQETVSASP